MIVRWSSGNHKMEAHPIGSWVRFSDHEKELTLLRAIRDAAKDFTRCQGGWGSAAEDHCLFNALSAYDKAMGER